MEQINKQQTNKNKQKNTHPHSVMLLPGGIAEMLETGTETEEVVYLKTRKGFVRFALKVICMFVCFIHSLISFLF
jgi:hypothetical protein